MLCPVYSGGEFDQSLPFRCTGKSDTYRVNLISILSIRKQNCCGPISIPWWRCSISPHSVHKGVYIRTLPSSSWAYIDCLVFIQRQWCLRSIANTNVQQNKNIKVIIVSILQLKSMLPSHSRDTSIWHKYYVIGLSESCWASSFNHTLRVIQETIVPLTIATLNVGTNYHCQPLCTDVVLQST